ncbi:MULTISPECIES: 5-oxoprolinase subunit PxpB [Halomonas]|uniref:KipI family sensor histidine kinase inhibitor n=1 Tax=Halomonas ventosae TaxID=229007 RepID=A0A4R6I5J6_9GAMM|nr:5-oxoprolinase subunit PxpB [Halomonas ventosae]TDO16551.1 KipI family sensor histidine kinase inhibitor [Halomonas ventosae]
MQDPRLENAGIDAWLVRLFERIDEANMPWLMALCDRCEQAFGEALVDLVPSYTTLLVHYRPQQLTASRARALLVDILADLAPDEAASTGETKEIPVWYDASVGPELVRLEYEKGLTRDEVIEIHSGHVYRVFALGFAPGFGFMGSVDPRLDTPRLATPRQRVPAGSVALAGRQTSAYPKVSPGGWNLLGRTPVTLFDPARERMSFLQVGDRVRFVAIGREAFERLGGDTTPVAAVQKVQS